jgi:asparagine synthase (glutamine-hydrolysing)
MCGICGKVYFDPEIQIDEHLLHRMCDVISHRGPDESGCYVDGNIGLGHRRLSIIDLTTGQQPMCNSRKDIRIVFNGEIYNFPELRQDLVKRGYQFLSTSDTEVIIHLYDEYGTACVKYLRGMFAFAIWDHHRRRLFLARDRVGQKPLFYAVTSDAIAFASEIKALLQDPAFKRKLDLTAMYHYLTYQYVPPPDTMFQGICKLPPAHTLVWEDGEITIDRYWDLDYAPKIHMDEHEMKEEIEHLLQESVKMRMISDVPIGAFLSGGIDSSFVVAFMSQYSTQPVNTFSIGFEEKEYNELPYARLIAERYKTKHHEFIVKPNAVEVLPKLIWHFDEPFGDSSAIPTYYLSQMTSQHVKVALNGDGGDESFAGYLRYLGYKAVRYYRIIPYGIRKKLMVPLLDRLYASPVLRTYAPVTLRRMRYLNNLSLESQENLYARTLTIFPYDLKLELLTEDVRSQFNGMNSLDYMFHYFQDDKVESSIDRMLYSDVMTYLPDDLLVKIDRMTMAHGLEGRSPFLDHKLMEFAASLPVEYKIRRTRLKYILKKIGQPWLPEKILSREKQGFGVPLGKWFQHELRDLVHDIFSSSYLVQEGILKKTTMNRIWQEHRTGKVNHYHRIWVLLNLELWYRMFIRNA